MIVGCYKIHIVDHLHIDFSEFDNHFFIKMHGIRRRRPRLGVFSRNLLLFVISLSIMFLKVIKISCAIEISLYLPALTTKLPTRDLKNNKFSIIMPTYSGRSDLIEKIVDNLIFNRSKYMEKLYIYWNDFNKDKKPTNNLLKLAAEHSNLIEIYDVKYRNLTSRYLFPPTLSTSTILSMDDDIFVNTTSLDNAFERYMNKSLRNKIAGPTARRCN